MPYLNKNQNFVSHGLYYYTYTYIILKEHEIKGIPSAARAGVMRSLGEKHCLEHAHTSRTLSPT